MRKTIYLIFFLIFSAGGLHAQCDPNVPTYVIDLSANADTTWILYEADAMDRLGQCCGVASSQNCIKFEITLNPNAAGIFFDYDGAGAFGSLNWREDCGVAHSLKDTICVTSQTFTLTFCKPGSDNGNYTLISVAKPTFPEDQFVPMNCVQPVEVLGVTSNTIEWESISPGTPGQYNGYLSCVNCLTPTFTPNPTGPTEIEYRVCGYPVLDYCVGAFDFCDTVKFTVQDSLLINISPAIPSFCSGGTTPLTAVATGGDGNYLYYWYNNSLQQVGTGLVYNAGIAGTYYCEVRDGNYEPGSCANFMATRVVVETFPPQVNAGPDQLICASSPNVNLLATYQYSTGVSWSGGAGVFTGGVMQDTNIYVPTTSEIINGITLTLSSVGVGGGCTNVTDQIHISFVDTVETNLTNQLLQCKYGNITVNPSITEGGMAPYTYAWTNGVNTGMNTLSEGTHCLAITDANNCQTSHCITISAPSAINLVTSSTPTLVNGSFDGTATATVSGGVGPYAYAWSNGGTTPTITGLGYGLYTVTVTDANGCTRTASVVVNNPMCSGFSVSTSTTSVLCHGGATGTATAIASGGSPAYTFSWNDPSVQSSATATALAAGVYTVIATDNLGCLAVNTATVIEPTALTNSFTSIDVTTEGGNDGQATAIASGGTGSYTYQWSNGGTTATITGLIAGIYPVIITDGNSCSINDAIQISEPPCNLFDAFIGTVAPLCNGDLNASANLVMINGVGPYSIQWSTGQLDVVAVTGLLAGFHSVQITDARGCSLYETFGISQPAALTVGLAGTPSSCNGSSNGTIDLSVYGGTYPYYYFNWSNGVSTEDQIGLDPGSYSVTITDENGCQASGSTSLVDPSELTFSYTSINATCSGYTDASIDMTVNGGTQPYAFSWSNGETTEDLTGIDLGGYILSLSDANACAPSESITILITEPDSVQTSAIDISCPLPGTNSSDLVISVIGGNTDYAISYDGGVTFNAYGDYNESLLVNNSYTIVAKDINGCLSQDSVITLDPMLQITAANFNPCFVTGQTEDDVTITVSGGSPGYSLSSDNGANFENVGVSVFVLPIGQTYDFVAMDSKGCVSASYQVLLPDSISIVGSTTDPTCFGFVNGDVNITVSGGNSPYDFTWSDGQTQEDAINLAAGNYTVTVSDANGCVQQGSFTLGQPQVLTLSLSSPVNFHDHNISLNGGSDGSIDLTISGGTSPYVYDWSTGGSTAGLSDLTAGIYSIVVTDAQGCMISDTIELTEPFELELPTAFTPNVDGLNDVFEIHGIEAYPNNELTVVNRWGNVVYTEEHYHNTWTGTLSNGEDLPDGVYFVILKINGGEIEKNSYVHIKTN